MNNQLNRSTPVEPVYDVALAASAAAGDEHAFERIMRANSRLLYRTARNILRDDPDAEAVLQESYLKAFYLLPRFNGECKLSTWLTRIVINQALERRRTPHRGAHADATQCKNLKPIASPPAPSPAVMAMHREMGRLVQSYLECLPDPLRIVFVLRTLEELSTEETAECLNVPVATVRTRLMSARRMLREHLASDVEAVLDATLPFDGARCERTVRGVLTRLRPELSKAPGAGRSRGSMRRAATLLKPKWWHWFAPRWSLFRS
jgi:RNA polymerase sigma-70 factor, ECF subfamily